jgi:hypothetical protein
MTNWNVIEEIQYQLKQNGLKEEDIFWIGSEDGQYSLYWKTFKEKFKDVEYNSGFGAQELASDLVIVMKDHTYFNRDEYDGAEGWTYNKVPVRSDYAKPFEYISVNQVAEIGWKSLGDLNKEKPIPCVTCGNPHIDKGFYNGNCFDCNRQMEMDFYHKHRRFPKDKEHLI